MIKVAIAGTNGLAQLLVCVIALIHGFGMLIRQAHYIDATTSHSFVIFSRRVSHQLL
jgi:hypothetical protein